MRNTKQHNWATLVEIIDLIYGTSIKEGKKTGDLKEFLYLYSDVKSLSEHEFSSMLRIEKKMRIFEKMSSVLTGNYNIKVQWLSLKPSNNYYVIVACRSGSSIESFNNFEQAEIAYYDKYTNRGDANIVLTHLAQNPTFKQISMAYSNYILAMHDFLDDYRYLVEQGIIESVKKGNISRFCRFFALYKRNIRYHIKDLNSEIDGIQKSIQSGEINRSQTNKWVRSVRDRISEWSRETVSFFTSLNAVSKERLFYRVYFKYQRRQLSKYY